MVYRSVIVKSDFSWLLHVNSHPVEPDKIPALMDVPPLLDLVVTAQLLHTVTSLVTCIRNPEPKFAKSKKMVNFCRGRKMSSQILIVVFVCRSKDRSMSVLYAVLPAIY